MADGLNLGQTESAGGLSGLTKKQKEMAFARSPMNNQEVNLSSMEKKEGVVAPGEATKVQQQTQGVGALAAAKRTVDTANNPQIAGMKANLGTFATRLEGAINQYLQGATTSAVNTGLAGGGELVYNPATGRYEAPDVDVTKNLQNVLGEKIAQRGAVEQAAAPFVGQRFEDTLQKFADVNNDGTIDPQEQQFLNASFSIVNSLRRLEQLDPYSPESEALKMQLAMQDRDGLVSGLRSAMDRYEDVSGMKIGGAEGESRTIKDILQMSSDSILQELEKAVEGGQGLFSGEASTSLKRSFDEATRQYAGATAEDVAISNKIKDTTTRWLEDYDSSLKGSRNELNRKFLQTADGVVAELDKAKAEAALAGEDTKWVDEAKRWFTDLQSSVKSGKANFAEVLQEMLNSEIGMAPEAKATLKKWLGDALGGGDQQTGELAKLLGEVADKGYALTKDENGNTKRVVFTSSDKQRIALILDNEDLSQEEKNAAITEIISAKSGRLGEDLKRDSQQVADFVKDGQFGTALQTFKNSLVTSLKSFKDSTVRELYNKLVTAGVSPDAMAGAIQQRGDTQLKAVTQAKDLTVKSLTDVKTKAEKDLAEVKAYYPILDGLMTEGVARVSQQVQASVGANVPAAKAALLKAYEGSVHQVPDDATLNEMAETYAWMNFLKKVEGTDFGAAVKQSFGSIFDYTKNMNWIFRTAPGHGEMYQRIRSFLADMPAIYGNYFRTTEAGRSISSKKVQLQNVENTANQLVTAPEGGVSKIDALLSDVENNYLNVTKSMTDIMSASPDQMFAAARTGDSKYLTKNYAGWGVEDFAKAGVQLSYTEDATSNEDITALGNNVAYVPPEFTIGDVGKLEQKPVPVTPKTPASVPSKTKDNKGPMGGVPHKEGANSTFHEVTTKSGQKIMVEVKYGENLRDVVNERFNDAEDPITSAKQVDQATYDKATTLEPEQYDIRDYERAGTKTGTSESRTGSGGGRIDKNRM